MDGSYHSEEIFGYKFSIEKNKVFLISVINYLHLRPDSEKVPLTINQEQYYRKLMKNECKKHLKTIVHQVLLLVQRHQVLRM
jgi:hypothetical protein